MHTCLCFPLSFQAFICFLFFSCFFLLYFFSFSILSCKCFPFFSVHIYFSSFSSTFNFYVIPHLLSSCLYHFSSKVLPSSPFFCGLHIPSFFLILPTVSYLTLLSSPSLNLTIFSPLHCLHFLNYLCHSAFNVQQKINPETNLCKPTYLNNLQITPDFLVLVFIC